MKRLVILRGISGSGKSTYARTLVAQGYKRFNRDQFREMLDSSHWSKANEKFVVEMQNYGVKKALEQNYNVVVDNTHLSEKPVKELHNIAAELGDTVVEEKWFTTPLDECLERNELREGNAKVPEKVLIDQFKQSLDLKKKGEILDIEVDYPEHMIFMQDGSLPEAIICDLDGTLANIGDRSPYDASKCENDKPNAPVVSCVNACWSAGYKVLFVSGREYKYKHQTENFINKCFPGFEILSYGGLYMRKTGDYRKDWVVKEEIFDEYIVDNYCVDFILDDRNSVVDHWRRIGLTIFQVAPGDF